MDIHQRIKAKRLEKGLSMQALADQVGLKGWQSVQQWEKSDTEGGTAPNRTRLARVAKALGVTPEWLQFGQDNSESKLIEHELDAERWPFSFSRQQFLSLPQNQQELINGYARGVIDAWESQQHEERHKTA